jgi:hypothetical protein
MTENTDLTPADAAQVMAPADVPDRLVEMGVMAMYGEIPGGWDNAAPGIMRRAMDRHADDVRAILAATLPLYGAAVIVQGGSAHYARQEALATSLTTRVYGSSLLISLAQEAEMAASMGMAPALNTELANMLRERAKREAKP